MGDDSHKFEDYLFKVIQECKSDEIVKKMRRMGLLILWSFIFQFNNIMISHEFRVSAAA